MKGTGQLLTRLGYVDEDIVRGEEAALKHYPACMAHRQLETFPRFNKTFTSASRSLAPRHGLLPLFIKDHGSSWV